MYNNIPIHNRKIYNTIIIFTNNGIMFLDVSVFEIGFKISICMR